MEFHSISDSETIGTRVLSRETIVEALKSGPTDFVNRKHITCNVDLSPLVKEEELNYLRLRYNEYLLQYASGPVDLEDLQLNLGQRQEEAESREQELQKLKDEVTRAEEERRNSADLLGQEAQEHRLQASQLEAEVEELKKEISRLREGCGAGLQRQMQLEVKSALNELEHLENEVDLKVQKIKELESQAAEKDNLLQNTRTELDSILSILDQVESGSAKKINSMKEAIGTKESQLSDLHLQIEALNTCKQQLETALEFSENKAKNLKEHVDEKERVIENFKNDNRKIIDELEVLKDILSQNELVAKDEADQNAQNENQVGSTLLSKEEQQRIQQRLAELEEQLEEKRKANDEAKAITKTMAAEIQVALELLDASTHRVEELVLENGALKSTNAKIKEEAKEEESLPDNKGGRIDAGNSGELDRSTIRQTVREGLDHVIETLRKNNDTVSTTTNSAPRSQILSHLDAADESLKAAENLLTHRSPEDQRTVQTTTWTSLENFFVRYYPLMLTCLFLILVVRANIFRTGSWNLWLPYFLFSALSFALPHPFGAIASLLAAFVVAASFFV